MDKYKIIDSDIIYDKFVEHYSSNRYKIDKRLIKKDNIYATAFCKLFFMYVVICLAIFIVSKLYPNEIFGGMTNRKMVTIFVRIFFVFLLIFILAITEFKTKKEEYSATLSLWKVLNEEKILDSEKRLEIVDFLYENNNEVGSFYIKLFNIIKSSVVIGYFKWLITLFIGFYAGIISSIFMKYIEKETGKDLLNYISLIGKELVTIFIIILFFSILYYIFINLFYKDYRREYDLYILALKNVKYIILRGVTKDEIQNLIKNPKEDSVMENKTDESKIIDKDTKVENSTKEPENYVRKNSEEKLNNHSIRSLYSLSILAIITLLISVVYVIIYYNSNSNFINSPILILGFYIILIFINIMYRILNNGMDLNFKHCKCLSNNFFKDNGLHYAFIFLIVVLCSKLLKLLNSELIDNNITNIIFKTIAISIILVIIGNTFNQIRIFLEKYKSS